MSNQLIHTPMSNLQQAQKVKYAVLNAPYLIPQYFKPPYNPVITRGILHKMLNRSCGIEIECFGSLSQMVSENREWDTDTRFKDVINYYGIMSYHEDDPNKPANDDYAFNEHQIRIKDHTQLNGLYELLQDMKKYCRLNEGSGIHIHMDITDVWAVNTEQEIKDNLVKQLNTRLDDIEHIFYPNGKYEAIYNTDRIASMNKGRNWVAVRSCMETVEFRIGPMSFEYSDIVRWCVELNKILNWAINQSPKFAYKCKTRPSIKVKQYKDLTTDTSIESDAKNRITHHSDFRAGAELIQKNDTTIDSITQYFNGQCSCNITVSQMRNIYEEAGLLPHTRSVEYIIESAIRRHRSLPRREVIRVRRDIAERPMLPEECYEVTSEPAGYVVPIPIPYL
jgi:hypothetical protein